MNKKNKESKHHSLNTCNMIIMIGAWSNVIKPFGLPHLNTILY